MYIVLPIFSRLIKLFIMQNTFINNWNTQVKKGLLIFLVMNVIKEKNCYGYEIIQKIKTDTGLEIADGTLYPLLKKLRQDALVLSRWSVNEELAPRKYYYLTGNGNSTLNEMNEYWLSLNQSITSLINS